MGAGRSVVWSAGIVLGLASPCDRGRGADGRGPPGRRHGLHPRRGRRARRVRRGPGAHRAQGPGAGHGERVRRRSLGAHPDEPARGRRRRGEEPVPRGRGGGLHREPAHRGRDRDRRRAGGVRGARGRLRRRERPRGPSGDRGRAALSPARGLGRDRSREAGEGPGLPVRPPGRGGEAGGQGRRAGGDGDRRLPVRRPRERGGRHALPPDRCHGQPREQRRAHAGRGRLRRRGRADEAGPGRDEPGRRLLGAGQRGQGLPRRERPQRPAAGRPGFGRACGTPSTGSGSRSSCPTGTRTSRPHASSRTRARWARSASAPIVWRPGGRSRRWRRRSSAGGSSRGSSRRRRRRAAGRRPDGESRSRGGGLPA